MWWRRRRQAGRGRADQARGAEVVPVPRLERALVALTYQVQQLDERMGRLERRLDAALETSLETPTQDDLLELRRQSMEAASEVSQLERRLRAEIQHVRIDAAMRPVAGAVDDTAGKRR